MNKMNTKALVEGAIFASVTALLGIMVYYIPFLSLLGMFWPAPIIIIGFRNGLKVSLISAVVAAIIVSIFTEPFSGIYMFLVFGISGILMGYFMYKKIRPSVNIAVSGVVLAICSVLGILFGFYIVGQSAGEALDQIIAAMEESINSAIAIYKSLGVPEDQLKTTAEKMKESLTAIQYIIPTIFFLTGLFFSFINYKLVKTILGRMKYQVEDVKPFSLWKVPDNFSIGMLVVIILVILGYYLKIPNMETVQINIIYIIKWVFTIIGLSAASFFLDKYNVSKAFKTISLIFIFVILSNYLALVGLLDTFFDFRKLKKKHIGGI